jgi:hypothetical protein
MHKRAIGRVAVGLLIVAALLCSVACTDQSDALSWAALNGDIQQIKILLEKRSRRKC